MLNNCPSWEMRIRFVPGTAATVIFPPSVSIVPVLMTVPPVKDILLSSVTFKSPALIITPDSELAKLKLLGLPTRFR